MVRVAKRPNQQRRQTAFAESIPAPVGGWNAKDALAAMPLSDAVILDNWIPRAGYCELRRGFVSHVSGSPKPVEAMIAHRGLPTGDKLFAATQGKLYDVTVAGAGLGPPLMSGFVSNHWNYTAFSNAGGEWTIAANGSDGPIGFDGTSWSTLALTGTSGPITLNPDALASVFAHAGRLYFLEGKSLRVWNPAAGAIQGACTLLELSSVFSKGGRLVCGGTWSWQFGVTADEFAVFMTDQGQLAIYQGIDPTDATNWSLVGVYDFGPPLGPKALMKYGGDLAIVTADGAIPLSQGLHLDRTQDAEVALTAKIVDAFASAVKKYQGNYGWQGILYPGLSPSTETDPGSGSLAIFNVPTSPLTKSVQFVQSMITGAWCRFTGINAFCWELANNCIYFGGVDGVYQWDQGAADNGEAIVGDVLSAYSAFGRGAMNKEFTMVRPVVNTVPAVQIAADIFADFNPTPIAAALSTISSSSVQPAVRMDWAGAGAIGYVGAARLQVNVQAAASTDVLGVGDAAGDVVGLPEVLVQSGPYDVTLQLYRFDVLFKPGAPL